MEIENMEIDEIVAAKAYDVVQRYIAAINAGMVTMGFGVTLVTHCATVSGSSAEAIPTPSTLAPANSMVSPRRSGILAKT